MKNMAMAYAIKKANGGGCYARGGEVSAMKDPMNMIDAIRMKRKKMAMGGMVENDNGIDDFDMDDAQNLEMVDGLEDHNDFLSAAPQEMSEEDPQMKRSKMLGGILARVRYGK